MCFLLCEPRGGRSLRMDLRLRRASAHSNLVRCATVIVVTFCGCADMLPSESTMEKWSPSNIWYRMQPNQLGRLNEGSGLSSDVYYSISDYPERSRSVTFANQASSSEATVVTPKDNGSTLR
jgi:hypothetical protein